MTITDFNIFNYSNVLETTLDKKENSTDLIQITFEEYIYTYTKVEKINRFHF